MTITIPIEKQRFYYNRKINCMPATGWVRHGETKHILTPDTCLGQLDWGRGVWAYNSLWLWASASGFLPDGRTLGLNMGYGFGDTSAASENAFILNGKLHKLEDELGAFVVALQPQYPLAELPPEKISQLQQAEKDLGVVLLAYKKD